jgi:hypothetical protein
MLALWHRSEARVEQLENEAQVLAHSVVTGCIVLSSGRILWTALDFTMAATVVCYLVPILTGID